jgi:hypothetical protein
LTEHGGSFNRIECLDRFSSMTGWKFRLPFTALSAIQRRAR